MPRNAPWLFRLAVAIPLLAGLAPSATATVVQDLTLDDLWALADCVIEAEVDSTRSTWDQTQTVIVTEVFLDVYAVYQGPCATGPRTLTVAGGVMDGVRLSYSMMPAFAPGETVLLFLDEYPGLLFPVLGVNQGKFTIAMDPGSGMEILHNARHSAIFRDAVFDARPARGDLR